MVCTIIRIIRWIRRNCEVWKHLRFLSQHFRSISPSLEVLETDSVHCKFKPSFLFDDIHVDVRNRGKVYTSTYFVHIFQSSRIVTCLNACLSSEEQYVIVFEYRSI